jgi:hypothetical protein
VPQKIIHIIFDLMNLSAKGSKLMKQIKAFKGVETLGLPADFSLLKYAALKG